TGRLLKTLEGHGGSVYSVSFSPDGKLLASGSWDNTIKIWDVREVFSSSSYYYYAFTPVEVKVKGRVFSFPKGSFFEFESGERVFRVSGKVFEGNPVDNLVKGKLIRLYPVKREVVFAKNTVVKIHPNSEIPIGEVEGGIITKRVFCTEEISFCYVRLEEIKGVVNPDNLYHINPYNDRLLVIKDTSLRDAPLGKEIKRIEKDSTVETIYRIPELGVYKVSFNGTQGWVDAQALRKLTFKNVNLTVVAKEKVPIKRSPYSDIVLGYVNKGEILWISKVEKTTGYYLIRNGFSSPKYFIRIKEVNPPKTMWNLEDTELYLTPEGKDAVKKVEKLTKFRILYETEDYYFGESKKGKGWVKKNVMSEKKTDLYKPVVNIKGGHGLMKIYVADDTSIAGVYVNGEPLMEFERVKYPGHLPFEPEDERVYYYRYNRLPQKITIMVEDNTGKVEYYHLSREDLE
ncbi:MAG: hypothetical protein DSY42_02610, partial [Aquifex sp.]